MEEEGEDKWIYADILIIITCWEIEDYYDRIQKSFAALDGLEEDVYISPSDMVRLNDRNGYMIINNKGEKEDIYYCWWD